MLAGVGLRLPAGMLAFIGGSNGAGKTTLLRLLCGLLEPDAGTVRVHGVLPQADRRAYQRRIAYLSAGNSGLYARLTVRQHLDLWARMTFIPPSERPDRIASALDRFDLGVFARRRADRMSMGQRQRLRIAMALLPPADVLLLDEPTTSLDADGAQRLQAAVRQRLDEGAAA